jgi:hypothetical protein
MTSSSTIPVIFRSGESKSRNSLVALVLVKQVKDEQVPSPIYVTRTNYCIKILLPMQYMNFEFAYSVSRK